MYKGEVIDYNHHGQGVIRNENKVVFVDNVKLGDIVDFEIVESKKTFDIGKVSESYLKKQKVDCKYYHKCGGCDLRHLSYDEQIEFKKKQITNSLRKQDIKIEEVDVIRNDEPNGYRNKSRYFLQFKDGMLQRSLYEKKTNDLISIDYCMLQSDDINNIINELVVNLNELPEKIKRKIKVIEVRKTYKPEEIMLIIETTSKIELGNVANKVADKYKQVVSLKNKFGKGSAELVFGKDYLTEKIYNKEFIIDDKSFFQVNTFQAKKMVEVVASISDFSNKVVLDAYSGSGFFSIAISDMCKQAVGIELNRFGVKKSKQTLKLNDINNVKYICGDIEKEVENAYKKYEFDLVIIDPPRKGMNKNFIEILKTYKPEEIIYVSCNPATYARDVKLLEGIYKVDNIKGLDMFSGTHHIEIISKLKLI